MQLKISDSRSECLKVKSTKLWKKVALPYETWKSMPL
jgi:hypothetical protein